MFWERSANDSFPTLRSQWQIIVSVASLDQNVQKRKVDVKSRLRDARGQLAVRASAQVRDHDRLQPRCRIRPNLAHELVLTRVNQLRIADFTYIRLLEGFAFLAVILDAFPAEDRLGAGSLVQSSMVLSAVHQKKSA